MGIRIVYLVLGCDLLNLYALIIALQVSSATNKTLNALQRARDSLGTESIKYSTASESNPGIPPSSFMSFLRQVWILSRQNIIVLSFLLPILEMNLHNILLLWCFSCLTNAHIAEV